MTQVIQDARGLHVRVDVNHRSGRSADPQAAARYGAALAQADLIFIAVRDLPVLFPQRQASDELTLALHARYLRAQTVVTRGMGRSTSINTQGEQFEHPALPARSPRRVGCGDAFATGFLYARVRSGDRGEALARGTAAAAMKMTTAGARLRATRGEVAAGLTPRSTTLKEDIQR